MRRPPYVCEITIAAALLTQACTLTGAIEGEPVQQGLQLDRGESEVFGSFGFQNDALSFHAVLVEERRAELAMEINGKAFAWHVDGVLGTQATTGHGAVLTARDRALLGEFTAAFEDAFRNVAKARPHEKLVAIAADFWRVAPEGYRHDARELRFSGRTVTYALEDEDDVHGGDVCLETGTTWTVAYDDANGAVSCSQVTVGDDWGTNESGTSGDYSCMGRCGAGCGGFGGGWTLDCLEHDVCGHDLNASGGGSDDNCGDEYDEAQDDFTSHMFGGPCNGNSSSIPPGADPLCGGGGGCTPDCSGDQCGQADGCGGTCPATDAGTCGMCGNAACASCGDGTCDAGEDCGSCAADCGTCGGGGGTCDGITYSASGTSSASFTDVDTVQYDIELNGGTTYTISTCGSTSTDTYLRLHNGGSQVAANDDACGRQSTMTYTPGSSGVFVLSLGCYSSGSCSATVSVSPDAVCTAEGSGGGGGGGSVVGIDESGLSASTGQELHFSMTVPAGGSAVSFAMSGGSGDADLYVKKGSVPTTSSYDCRPYQGGNNESCGGSGAGTYYVMVRGYSSFSGVSLLGTYTAP